MAYLANHKASAAHNGITANSAFLIPRASALASEHTIPCSRSSHAHLCSNNSKRSTSPVRARDFGDVLSTFIVISNSSLRCPISCLVLCMLRASPRAPRLEIERIHHRRTPAEIFVEIATKRDASPVSGFTRAATLPSVVVRSFSLLAIGRL